MVLPCHAYKHIRSSHMQYSSWRHTSAFLLLFVISSVPNAIIFKDNVIVFCQNATFVLKKMLFKTHWNWWQWISSLMNMALWCFMAYYFANSCHVDSSAKQFHWFKMRLIIPRNYGFYRIYNPLIVRTQIVELFWQ